MTQTPIFVGNTPLQTGYAPVEGDFTRIDETPCYRITNYDHLPPFFMSIVSDSELWMFVSSRGALSAGRQNPERALFPYYTVDKIHDSQDITGSTTLMLVERGGKTHLWAPFSGTYTGIYTTRRNLYKSIYGNAVFFEETNEDLGLSFRYAWHLSHTFGFIKRARLVNISDKPVQVRLVDGIQNLLHYGIDQLLQQNRSNLLDAYKKNELEQETGLGIYALSSLVVDKPVPSETLKATTVWSTGMKPSGYLISNRQLNRFKTGHPVQPEHDVRAERGAYFVQTALNLPPGNQQSWFIVADIDQGPEDVVALSEKLKQNGDFSTLLEQDIQSGTNRLMHIVGTADGLQRTQDAMTTSRHYANVLFNVMRGGVFDNHYTIDLVDFVQFVEDANQAVARRHRDSLDDLTRKSDPEGVITLQVLAEKITSMNNPQLSRLYHEYLPLTFSRRHGDPSRPWNAFSIDLVNDDGSKKRSYQGNWRDIFQNWEALCISYPGFLESIIAKFVNASTADGYNPYRITRDGIDWETHDPDDPWSYIGYWGDHQIVYLLKLLELSLAHHPERLKELLATPIFSYANVPYRIKPYTHLIRDPHNTIQYDTTGDVLIASRVESVGFDGKLIWNRDQEVYLVTLAEKLLVTVLAKLSNFIPEGGIWMNTQRPEWNDANNALVGYGVSMVTLCYLRRFNAFAADLFGALGDMQLDLSEEVAAFMDSVATTFNQYRTLLSGPISDEDRRRIVDQLGEAGTAYRTGLYDHGFSEHKVQVEAATIRTFFEETLDYLDHTIHANQRPDKLYHSYNLLQTDGEQGLSISHLYEMLEGQVAVLSAGTLTGQESIDVLRALKSSALYREDQNSYLLYPNRQLPRFLQKNEIPLDKVTASPLLQALTAKNNPRLVVRNVQGAYHFNGDLKDKESLLDALETLKGEGFTTEVYRHGDDIVALYETLFDHASYTGRSGTFFGYEGLGCIYWHMVSKLVLAIKETYYRIYAEESDPTIRGALVEHYFDVRAGIGLNKSPESYGAFPMDPYSHTPGHVGARQPGMTGQVKEDIISRWGELGLVVENGMLRFMPVLLRKLEFVDQPTSFTYFDLHGDQQTLELPAASIGFTYCQVPIVYHAIDAATPPGIALHFADGNTKLIEGLTLTADYSKHLFERTGLLNRIEVALVPEL